VAAPRLDEISVLNASALLVHLVRCLVVARVTKVVDELLGRLHRSRGDDELAHHPPAVAGCGASSFKPCQPASASALTTTGIPDSDAGNRFIR